MTDESEPSEPSEPSERFQCFEVCAEDREAAERAAAEAWSAGAVGVEELGEAGEVIVVHAPSGFADALARQCAGVPGVLHVGPVSAVAPVVWSEAWKQGLAAIEVSSRLVVRPPFVEHALEPGQREVVIEPGQAFGTGAHASTRLVLVWLDELLSQAGARAAGRVLDVGTGSGVLALAALQLGAAHAVGFDLDPLATEAASVAARDNGLASRLSLYTGGIEAVAGERFDWVLANLLRSEMLPIAGELVAAVAPGGVLVLAGLLEGDISLIRERFGSLGLELMGSKEQCDSDGERWVGLVLRRAH